MESNKWGTSHINFGNVCGIFLDIWHVVSWHTTGILNLFQNDSIRNLDTGRDLEENVDVEGIPSSLQAC